jgi:hypothetical protein
MVGFDHPTEEGGWTVAAGPITTAPETKRRASPAARRVGYLMAVGINVLLLWLLLVQPGWRWLGFLTASFTAVLGWVVMSLLAGVVVNLALVAYDPPWVRRLGDAVTAAVATVALARLWAVFPFDLGSWSGWEPALRFALGLVCVGTAIGAVANVAEAIRLARTGA